MSASKKTASARPAARKSAAKPRTAPPVDPFDCLPMSGPVDPKTTSNGRRRSLWVVKRTGDYGFDCCLGAELARLTLRVMREQRHSPLLGQIVADMLHGGQFGGVEVGFLHTFAEAAMRGGAGQS